MKQKMKEYDELKKDFENEKNKSNKNIKIIGIDNINNYIPQL